MFKEFTAKQLHNAPAQVFRAADRDGVALIHHGHYKDRVFELTAKEIDLDGEMMAALVEGKRILDERGDGNGK